MRKLAMPIAAFLGLFTASSVAYADTLWTTNPNMPTLFSWDMIGPSVQTPATDREVADDFNAIGLIEQVLADGDDCQGCYSGQPVTGVYVRFYEWTAAGPGALQSEQFLAAADPNFVWTPGSGPEFLEITLPQPFQATGWHFVSVQVTFGAESASTGKWYFHPVNWGATMGSRVYLRDHNAGGAWSPVGSNPHDASFALIGTSGGPTPMSILTATSDPVTPSSRLRITGDGFGNAQGGGQVRVNNLPAIITTWSDTVIVAYVPEQTALGDARLTVVADDQQSDSLDITVLPREADGPVAWRFAVDADIISHRPGIAPDGSIYVNEYNQGRLYKLTPDGGLLWVVDALRGQVGSGAEGPIAVAPDGTVILAVNPLGPAVEIVAYSPDGLLQWVFTNPNAVGAASGPALGPDGNLYCTFSITADGQMGAVSLDPAGGLRWSSSGEPFIHIDAVIGAELAFSSSTLGGPVNQIALATTSDLQSVLYGLSMSDGDTNWSHTFAFSDPYLMQLQPEAAAGPGGMVYITESNVGSPAGWGLHARHPANGEPMWVFDPGILSEVSAPVVGSDGTIYLSWDLGRVSAVTPQGQHIWTYDGGPGGVQRMPAVSPNNQFVLFGGGPFGQSGFIKALDASNGQLILHVDLQTPAGTIFAVDRPAFTPDSRIAYYPTGIVNDVGNEHCYLYALNLPAGSGPAGDIDRDGDVDLSDYALLAGCLGGPVSGIDDGCELADLDADGHIALADVARFQAAFGR